jgi:hypothetical protein
MLFEGNAMVIMAKNKTTAPIPIFINLYFLERYSVAIPLATLSAPTVKSTIAKITIAVKGASFGTAITVIERIIAADPIAI